ncbi:sortase [Candidatus Saccharibacteria bacterium]|nr:sortase [Candidatus Saccharibacteria bacterium]
MSTDDNPLFDPSKYNIPTKHGKVIKPVHDNIVPDPVSKKTGATEVVSLLRGRIDKLYANEPDAQEELAEAEAAGRNRSKHQQFMHEISTSGKSLAEIQTAWHAYYQELPNEEKHQVWQEFYSEHAKASRHAQAAVHKQKTHSSESNVSQASHHAAKAQPLKRKNDTRTVSAIKTELLHKVITRRPTKRGHAGHSLLFGLGMGGLVAAIMLFSFFNERFVAPFISPSKSVSNTPIIIDPASTAVGPESKIIIPKINVEIPVVFDEESTEEAAVQNALEEGVIHYGTTSNPGEQGNGAIFGHSSNNILNKGKYKFAFVLLKRLESGDIFYVQTGGKRFAYRVYKKTVVTPEEVSVLGTQDKPSTMSLITCDPPGTSINRLVVVGEQISPDPTVNVASSAQPGGVAPALLPSNAPSLWSRFTSWLST